MTGSIKKIVRVQEETKEMINLQTQLQGTLRLEEATNLYSEEEPELEHSEGT